MSKLRRVAHVLKERFPNLTADETIELAEVAAEPDSIRAGLLEAEATAGRQRG